MLIPFFLSFWICLEVLSSLLFNLLPKPSSAKSCGKPKAEIKQRVAEMLELIHLGNLGARYPAQLSGGQQARFQVLLLELSGATLLLLDEPTDNLDLESADALQAGLEGFEGTVVAVTHDRWFAGGFDRFLHLGADGTVRETPEPVWDAGRLDPRLRDSL